MPGEDYKPSKPDSAFLNELTKGKKSTHYISESEDKERAIVVGTHCTYFDFKENALPGQNSRLLCPHCKTQLFEMTVGKFQELMATQIKNVPGHKGFLNWAQGKCFINEARAIKVFNRVMAPQGSA